MMKRTIGLFFVLLFMAMLAACDSQKENTGQGEVTKKLVPGETAPSAPSGSKGFGMPQTSRQDMDMQRRLRVSASITDAREIDTLTLDEMSMSDPFILADDATHTYYMTGSGGSIYKSRDLETWTGPYGAYDVTGTWMEGVTRVAAAELHHINGKYYYVATFRDGDDLVDVVPRRYNIHRQQSMILESDMAGGPYKPFYSDPDHDYLPHNWAILDGTLWYEDGVPYFVFVHEWLQTIDGTIEYVKLSPDLREAITEPKCLFRASEAPWALEMVGNGEMTYGLKIPGWVTDAPQLFRTQTGRLGMLWSSWGAGRYAEGVAYSESGTIDGPWIQQEKPLKGDNSGHGMMFTTFDGKRLLVIHHAEGDGPRKPQLYEIDDSGDELVLGQEYNGNR